MDSPEHHYVEEEKWPSLLTGNDISIIEYVAGLVGS